MIESLINDWQKKLYPRVSIDSRKVTTGDLFFALKGPNFDGHAFITQAIENGAAGIVCGDCMFSADTARIYHVEDTFKALVELGISHRQRNFCPAIALTGSNGKTSVKEMIASILPKPCHKTPGNFNNEIGVPLSLLGLKSNDLYAVFELGASHLHEIAKTVAWVKPQVSLINNIAPAHIEGFGSIDGVAQAKGEIYQGLASDGVACINDDDDYAHFWDDLLPTQSVIRFSAKHHADVYAENIVFDDDHNAQFTLNIKGRQQLICLKVPGIHNVSNALAAAACVHALGITLSDIKNGLESFTGVTGRLTSYTGLKGSLIIDDTYNANLRSTIMALEALSKHSGHRIFIFGDMGELGEHALSHHEQVGATAKALNIDEIMTVGHFSEHASVAFGTHDSHFSSKQSLLAALEDKLAPSTTILVKGSRSAAMEEIVKKIVVE